MYSNIRIRDAFSFHVSYSHHSNFSPISQCLVDATSFLCIDWPSTFLRFSPWILGTEVVHKIFKSLCDTHLNGAIPIKLFFLCMNKIIFFFLVPCLLTACAVKTPISDVDLTTLLEDMEKKAYVIRQFRAELVKTRLSEAFDRRLSVKGTLVFQKPGRFRLLLTGDVNVEVLSDGDYIRLIHDNKDEETYRLRGDRDLSRFADPLMLLINSIGDGGLRKFILVNNGTQDNTLMLEVFLGNENHFERTERIFLWFSVLGEIRKIKILFKNGNSDETVFESWAMLAENDPEIQELDEKLKKIAEPFDSGP